MRLSIITLFLLLSNLVVNSQTTRGVTPITEPRVTLTVNNVVNIGSILKIGISVTGNSDGSCYPDLFYTKNGVEYVLTGTELLIDNGFELGEHSITAKNCGQTKTVTFKVVNYKIASRLNLIGTNNNAGGCAADGLASLLIQIDNISNIEFKEISLNLSDKNGYEGTILLGKLQDANLTTHIDRSPEKKSTYRYFYTAPDLFEDREKSMYKNKPDRNVKVKIEALSKDGVYVKDSIFINIIRPPVILVHGYNSDYKTFEKLDTALLKSGNYYSWQIHNKSYDGLASFDSNKTIVGNRIKFMTQQELAFRGYASSQADVIGHSIDRKSVV